MEGREQVRMASEGDYLEGAAVADRAQASGLTGTVTLVAFVAGVVLALSMAPAAAATIRYAAPHGTGAQPCLQSDPCNSVKAITGTGTNGVQDSDQVILEPGIYTPGQEIDITKAIDVGGQAGAAATVLDESGNSDSWGVLVSRSSATVHDLAIINVTTPTSAAFASSGGLTERLYASNAGSSFGCSVAGTTHLRDSVCSSASGIGLVVSDGATTARNVTASGGGGSGYGIEALANLGLPTSLDALNVIAVNGVHAETDSSSGASATFTLSHSNYATATHSGTGATVTPAGSNGNQTAAPLLSADFHELAGSPTIDAGLAALDIGSLDLDRNPRGVSGVPACTEPQPGPPDIGAYELAPAPLVSPSCISNKFSFSVKGKKLLVAVEAGGTVAVSDAGAKLSASAAKKKRRLLLKPSSGSGDPPTITVPLSLSKQAKSRLKKNGKVVVNAQITFTPGGGLANTRTAKLKLKSKKKS